MAGAGRALAAEAVREGFEVVVAAGGDGTVNEVVNGLGDSPGGFRQCCIGVLPWGTANVFAKELGLPSTVAEAWDVICSGRERLIDLPVVEWGMQEIARPSIGSSGATWPGNGGQQRYFTQLAGVGFDARSVELVDWKLKKKIGYLAYVFAVMKAMRDGRCRIRLGDNPDAITGEAVLFGNGRFYGGTHTFFPEAKLDDGKLDVVVFPRITWSVALRFLWKLMLRHVPPHAGAKCFQVDSLTLASSPPAPIEIDGEPVGHLPARFGVQSKALRVIVP